MTGFDSWDAETHLRKITSIKTHLSAFIRPMLPQAMLKCINRVHLQAALTPLAQCHMHL